MKEKLQKALRFAKKPSSIIGAVILVIIIVIFAVVRNGGDSEYEFVVAERRDLTQEVSVTGRVKAAESVSLAFEQTGTVSQVLADVRDNVTAGQTLVTLRNNDITALLSQAGAELDAERAKLNELTKNEDAEQDLENSYNDALNTINDALAKAEDAVRSKTAGLFSGSKSSGYNLTFSACGGAVSIAAKTLKLNAELELDKWYRELGRLGTNPSREALDGALVDAQAHLDVVEQFVDSINRALLTDCATDNSTLDSARINMATAQTNVLTATGNVNTLQQAIASQKILVANDDAVAAQRARVRAAEASVQNYRAQLAQTVIVSPIDGVVTKQDAKIGEAVSINTVVVSVISVADFEIETHVPEVDIANLKVGDTAVVTLDPYGSDVIFQASVVAIDPAETVIEGVSTYKTTLQFRDKDDRIKSGMTANIDILTDKKEGVIAVPARAIITKDNKKTVRVLDDGDITEVSVTTGLRGSDGTIEIVNGVNEGDKIVTFAP